MNSAEHLERHLGRMERGWSSDSLPGVQICLFPDQPASGVLTLSTLGLSNTVLSMNDDRRVRQELILAVTADEEPDGYAKLLLHVADQLSSSGRALLRGDVVMLQSPIARGSSAAALYASIPTAYPEELSTLSETAPPTVFVWLFPLLPSETAFVRKSGWNEFETQLELRNPDLFDVRRKAVM